MLIRVYRVIAALSGGRGLSVSWVGRWDRTISNFSNSHQVSSVSSSSRVPSMIVIKNLFEMKTMSLLEHRKLGFAWFLS